VGRQIRRVRDKAGACLSSTAIAMRNVRRCPFRSLGIAAAMCIMSASLVAIAVAVESVSSAVGRGAGRLGADIVVVPRAGALTADSPAEPMNFAPRYLDYSVVDKLKHVEIIVPQYGGRPPVKKPAVAAATAQLSFVVPDSSAAGGASLHVVGFEPETDLTVLPWLNDALPRPLGPTDALVGSHLGHTVGEHIDVLENLQVKVVSILGKTGMDAMDRTMFVPLPTAWKILQRLGAQANGAVPEGPAKPVTAIDVRCPQDVEPQQAVNFIRSRIADVDPKILHRAMDVLGAQLRSGIRNMTLIGIVVWVMTLLLVGAAFSMLVRERQREMGLLRAMGAKRSDIAILLAKEVCSLCAVGGGLGVVIGITTCSGINGIIESYLGIAYQGTDWTQMALIGILCLALAPTTGLLAALAPTARASIMDPHTAIHEGQ
jgi:putative ABC transport system permease protein